MFNILSYIMFKIRFRFYSKSMISRYQKKRIKKIISYSINNSKFFKEEYKDSDLNDFFHLPITNKKIMMENLSDYNTLGLNKKQLIDFALEIEKTRDFSKRYNGINIGMSSGTSGNKGIIITTRAEEDFLKTMYLSRLTIPKNEKLNAAFILRVFSPAFNFNKYGHKITYVNQLQSLDNICRDIENINPNVISSPPSMLKLLAKEQINGKLKISPKLIYSYAETLYPDVKKLIEKTFNCSVFQVYQGSEGCYGLSCKEGNIHINEDLVFLEMYDSDGKITKEGKPCQKLIVSDLHKKSQPIIRYELNDIITISKNKCKCGSNFRVIESIQGRSDDMLFGKKKGKAHFIFQDYVVRAIINCSDKIDDFQVLQKSLDLLKVNLLLKGNKKKINIKKEVVRAIESVYKKYECELPKINVIFNKPKPNKNSGKLARVISELKK